MEMILEFLRQHIHEMKQTDIRHLEAGFRFLRQMTRCTGEDDRVIASMMELLVNTEEELAVIILEDERIYHYNQIRRTQ